MTHQLRFRPVNYADRTLQPLVAQIRGKRVVVAEIQKEIRNFSFVKQRFVAARMTGPDRFAFRRAVPL